MRSRGSRAGSTGADEGIGTAAGTGALGFEAFYEDQWPGALRLATLLTSSADDGRDVAQDAFVGMYRRWDGIAEPRAYLRRAVVNGSTRIYRHRSSQRTKSQRWGAELAVDAPAELTYLADVIGTLPAKQRSVVVLRYYLGLTEKEIAATLDIAVGSVGPTLHRALDRLRKEVER